MIIDNLTATNVYVEKRKMLTITANQDINNNGVLEVDDNKNQLVSIIDTGDTKLYKLKSYSGDGGLMLYNPTTHHIQIAQEGSFLQVGLDFIKGTRYFINAKRVMSTSVTGTTFQVPLNGLKIFKIFLDNGREVSDYIEEGNSITVNGLQRVFVDEFSKIEVFCYESIEIADNSTSFQIEYMGYDTIFDMDKFIEEDNFIPPIFNGREVTLFESVVLNSSTTKETFKSNFEYRGKGIIQSVKNTFELSIFGVSDIDDIYSYLGSDEFRLICVNPTFGRVVLVNNCYIENGVSINLEKEKNLKRTTVDCGNYIDILSSYAEAYGTGRYGVGSYGGMRIVNSHRTKGGLA